MQVRTSGITIGVEGLRGRQSVNQVKGIRRDHTMRRRGGADKGTREEVDRRSDRPSIVGVSLRA